MHQKVVFFSRVKQDYMDMILGPWWPFLILALVVLVLCILAYHYPEWHVARWKAIEVVATLVMAAAAVSIPLVLDRSARDTRTLELLNEASRRIAEAAGKKDELDIRNRMTGVARFSYDYISNNPDVRTAVFNILNEYEYICLGGNQGLFSNSIIENLRWSALDQTWKDYHDYIGQHRKAGGSRAEAWIQCDAWLRKNPHRP
jgi:hypothetical protein